MAPMTPTRGVVDTRITTRSWRRNAAAGCSRSTNWSGDCSFVRSSTTCGPRSRGQWTAVVGSTTSWGCGSSPRSRNSRWRTVRPVLGSGRNEPSRLHRPRRPGIALRSSARPRRTSVIAASLPPRTPWRSTPSGAAWRDCQAAHIPVITLSVAEATLGSTEQAFRYVNDGVEARGNRQLGRSLHSPGRRRDVGGRFRRTIGELVRSRSADLRTRNRESDAPRHDPVHVCVRRAQPRPCDRVGEP